MSEQPKTGYEVIPDGWFKMPDANEQPRTVGDAVWNFQFKQWVVLPDAVTTQAANRNNWPAIRHQFAPLKDKETEAFEVVASFKLPIPSSQLGQLGRLVESTHKLNKLFIRQTGMYLEFVRNRETG